MALTGNREASGCTEALTSTPMSVCNQGSTCKPAPLAPQANQKHQPRTECEQTVLNVANTAFFSKASLLEPARYVRSGISEPAPKCHTSLQQMKCQGIFHSQYYPMSCEEFRALNMNYIFMLLREHSQNRPENY